jgi:hypothetical protein
MFVLDLFNTDHERRIAEGAVDQLEQRRIDDLAMKMDELVARAKDPAYKKNPAALAALMKEFQKCKAERDSYYMIRNEELSGEEFNQRMSQLGKDASAGITQSMNKQSDARIAALRNPTKEKSFMQQVGDKQIGMVKGAWKGLTNPGSLGEAKADYNFNAEDLKRLERIRDLATLKTQALELISRPSAKPMKPEKVEWFKNALEKMNSPLKVIKLMYDLLLSGEGHAVVGSKSSMNPNSYRQRFGEEETAEAGIPGNVPVEKIPGKEDLLKGRGRTYYEDQKKNSELEEARLAVGDPITVTAPNEFEGKTGEIQELSPSGKFVVVDLYNHGKHSMHLSDVEYNQYSDDENNDDWYDDIDDGVRHAYDSDERTRSDQFEGYQDSSDSPVAGAITRRILSQRLDLLKQYGPELVGAAVDNVADYVGDVDEIGSSDVSGWVMQVERMLKENPPEAFDEGWSDAVVARRTGQPRTPYSVYIKGKKWKDFENDDHAEAVANKLRAKFKADGRDPGVITIAPTNIPEGLAETTLNPRDPKGDYAAKRKALQDLGMNKAVDQAAVLQRRLDLDREAKAKGITETVVDVKSGMARIYRQLAPKIERHRDSFLAGQLYDELENYAELHGAEREFKQMMNGARNRAHMEYDTNPGGFQNWFWFLPFEDGDVAEGLMKEPTNRKEYLDQRDKLFRMMAVDSNPANKQIIKQALQDLEARYGNLKNTVKEESSTDSEAVERAILNRIMVAHTDLLMKFGPEKVMQAAEEVAYNVGDVDEIGTSDVSAYVNQVKQILGA